MFKRFIAPAIAALALIGGATACESDADVASKNVSKAADNFEVFRNIVFINGITDKYLLTIEGFCALGNDDDPGELSVTCETGPNQFKKFFLGLSDNVTYVVDQPEPIGVSKYQYRVVFRPSQIVPDFDMKAEEVNL